MGATSGEGTAYPFGNLSSPSFSVGFFLLSLVCPFVLFLLTIVLSVLRITASD